MFDQITPALVAMIVAIIAAVGGYLAAQVRILRKKATDAVVNDVPGDWLWLAEAVARTAVRAAYQLFPPDDTQGMLLYALDFIKSELKKQGVELTDADDARIRAVLEAAVADFYIALGKPEMLGA